MTPVLEFCDKHDYRIIFLGNDGELDHEKEFVGKGLGSGNTIPSAIEN